MQKLTQLTGAISDKRDGSTLLEMIKGLYNALSTKIFVSGAIAIATTTTAVKTAAAIYGVAGGILFTKAATDNLFTLAGSVTNAKFNVFALFLDANGTATAAMGTEGAALVNVKFPPIPAKTCCIGYVIINPTGTGPFVGGTTPLGDATVVPNAVYVNTVLDFDPTALV
jgi:hypothetical protein